MLDISKFSTAASHYRLGLRLAALGMLAGLSYGVAATAPASAAPTDWQLACQDKAAPQGYGESIRYNNCIRQRDCERLANEEGQMTMTMGCFGVMPDASPVPSRARR